MPFAWCSTAGRWRKWRWEDEDEDKRLLDSDWSLLVVYDTNLKLWRRATRYEKEKMRRERRRNADENTDARKMDCYTNTWGCRVVVTVDMQKPRWHEPIRDEVVSNDIGEQNMRVDDMSDDGELKVDTQIEFEGEGFEEAMAHDVGANEENAEAYYQNVAEHVEPMGEQPGVATGQFDHKTDDDGELKMEAEVEFKGVDSEEAKNDPSLAEQVKPTSEEAGVVQDHGDLKVDRQTEGEDFQSAEIEEAGGESKLAEQVDSKNDRYHAVQEQSECETPRSLGKALCACYEELGKAKQKQKVLSELHRAGKVQALQQEFDIDITEFKHKRAEIRGQVEAWLTKIEELKARKKRFDDTRHCMRTDDYEDL
eukprot:TRINITY_DN32279_c0_g1_i3.p1 TRINITY_DN32279_c0_g1~~TRINITY_DN32279_c0_g1_i3.p1  ORF type:complete len:367 (+),score=112.78 TRINITY_DN32279_c0_g1_i3:98-1198(+)